MKKRVLFVCFLSSKLFAFSCDDNFPVGARSAALSNASVTLNDVWSVQNNQAALAYVRTISGGVYYENKFWVKELALKAGAFAIPVKGGAFGLLITDYGYTLYKQNKYALSFAKSFGENFSMGISSDYLTTKIGEGYGTKSKLVVEMGLLSKPFKNVIVGAHVFNPTRTKLAMYNKEQIPTVFRLGANYTFSDHVLLVVETEKDMSKPVLFKTGIEYKPVKEFYLRVGIATNPVLSSFGFGLNLKKFQLDISSHYSTPLGFSPQLGIVYTYKKKEDEGLKLIEP